MNRFRQYTLSLLIVLGIFLLLYEASNRETKEVMGTVTGLTVRHTEEGSKPYLIVKLDNNRTAIARIQQSSIYHKGKRVLLLEMTSKYLGSHYRLKQYLP